MAKEDFYVHIDLNNQQILNTSLQNLGVAPSTANKTAGWIYWNTVDKTAYVYTGLSSPNEWLDLGALYEHPTYTPSNDASTTLTGATVISGVTLEPNGHISTITTRTLTASEIGAAGVTHTHAFGEVTGLPVNTILANNTGATAAASAITPAQLLVMLGIAYGTLAQLNTGTDTAQRTYTPKDISDFVNSKVSALSTASNLSLGTRTDTTMLVNNSNGTGVNLPSATTTLAGLLQSTDKTKLDGIASNANNYIHPTHNLTANSFATAITSGLQVLSKVTIAANGHVTEVGGRTLTASDIAAVLFNNAITNGVNQTWSSTKINNEIQSAITQAQTGGLQYKGEYNAGTNIPAVTTNTLIKVGWTYVITGATATFAGEEVEAGDMIIAKVDNPQSAAANWQVVNKNIPAILAASSTVEGIVFLATTAEGIAGTNNTKAITPLVLKAVLDARTGGYATTFGDGSATSFTFTHGLNTQDVTIQIQRISDRKVIYAERLATTTGTVQVISNIAPALNAWRIIIKK